MSKKQNKIKSDQLGLNFSTACNQLRKSVMFSLIQKCEMDICHRCKEKIETVEELSLDHIEDWLHTENASELFFDVENIAFSHKTCNVAARKSKIAEGGTSKFKGVNSELKRGYTKSPWKSSISHKNKSIYLGHFKTEIKAAKAYDEQALKLHGERAVTNEMLGLYKQTDDKK